MHVRHTRIEEGPKPSDGQPDSGPSMNVRSGERDVQRARGVQSPLQTRTSWASAGRRRRRRGARRKSGGRRRPLAHAEAGARTRSATRVAVGFIMLVRDRSMPGSCAAASKDKGFPDFILPEDSVPADRPRTVIWATPGHLWGLSESQLRHSTRRLFFAAGSSSLALARFPRAQCLAAGFPASAPVRSGKAFGADASASAEGPAPVDPWLPRSRLSLGRQETISPAIGGEAHSLSIGRMSPFAFRNMLIPAPTCRAPHTCQSRPSRRWQRNPPWR